MPNSFGNPFAIPQVQMTGLKNIPQFGGLAALLKSQQAILQQQALQARIAAMRARAAGGGGGLQTNKYTDIRKLPKADGTKEPILVVGATQKERDAKYNTMLEERRRGIIDSDPELAKLREGFDKKSLPAQKEALDKMRQSIAPRLSRVLGMPGEDVTKGLTKDFQAQYDQRQKDVYGFHPWDTIKGAVKSIAGTFSGALSALGKSADEKLTIGNAMRDERQATQSAYQDELQRLQAEGKSTTDTRLSNPFKAAVEFGEPILGTVLPAVAGGVVGTALGGPAGGLAGIVAGGGAAGAMYGGGSALERVASDPNLTDAQRRESIDSAYALGAGISGGLGAIPVGPVGLARGIMGRNAINRATARAAEEIAAQKGALSALEQATANRAARVAGIEEVNRQLAGQSLKRRIGAELGTNMTDMAALNSAFVLANNAGYNAATNQNLPITEGLGEAVLSGAGLGALFGLPGARRVMRARNRYGIEAPLNAKDAQLMQEWPQGQKPASAEQPSAGAGSSVEQQAIEHTPQPMGPAPDGKMSQVDLVNLIKKAKNSKTFEAQLEKLYRDGSVTPDMVASAFDNLNYKSTVTKDGRYQNYKRRANASVLDRISKEQQNVVGNSEATGGGSGAAPSVEQPGQQGAGRAAPENISPDSQFAVSPEGVVEPVANINAPQAPRSDTATQERGPYGEKPLNPGEAQENVAAPREPGLGGTTQSNGEPGVKPATPRPSEPGEGGRGTQLEEGAGAGSGSNAANAGRADFVKAYETARQKVVANIEAKLRSRKASSPDIPGYIANEQWREVGDVLASMGLRDKMLANDLRALYLTRRHVKDGAPLLNDVALRIEEINNRENFVEPNPVAPVEQQAATERENRQLAGYKEEAAPARKTRKRVQEEIPLAQEQYSTPEEIPATPRPIPEENLREMDAKKADEILNSISDKEKAALDRLLNLHEKNVGKTEKKIKSYLQNASSNVATAQSLIDAIPENELIGKGNPFPKDDIATARAKATALLVRQGLSEISSDYAKPLTVKEKKIVSKLGIGPLVFSPKELEAIQQQIEITDANITVLDAVLADPVKAQADIIKRLCR